MLFLYLDESGNYVFSKKGSEYLIFTALSSNNPFKLHYGLCEMEKKLRKANIMKVDEKCFHATEDKQAVRDGVFKILRGCNNFAVDSIIIEKAKTNPTLREETKLYIKIYHCLFDYIFQRYTKVEKILIYFDAAPVKKKRHVFEKGVKEALSKILHKERIGREIIYSIQYLPTSSSYGLQAVDYCAWSLKKRWGDWGEKIDSRPYNCISRKVNSEFEIFNDSTTKYY